MTSLLPAPTSPLRRAAGTLLRSPLGTVLESLTAPHGVDRYLELLDPMLARDTGRALVTAVHRETDDTTTLTLRPRRWDGHVAGQYVQVGVEVDGRRHVRCYSVSSSEHRDDGQLTITVHADRDSTEAGIVSPFLVHEARPGLVVDVSPAQGEFALPRRRLDHVLLISGGSGITPVMSILRTLVDEGAPTRITFLHYARTAADVPFADELRDLHGRRPNVDVEVVTTREVGTTGRGLTGHLHPDHLAALTGAPTPDAPTFVCGPTSLIADATTLWDDAGHADRLHVERFQLTPAVTPTDDSGDAAPPPQTASINLRSPPPPSPFDCRLDFLSADPYGNPIYGSDGNLNMEFVVILRLKEDTADAGSYDPYTCKVRDSFFYECLDIASPKTLSSSINGSFGVSASSTAFTWLSDGLNTSSTNFFGGPALCNDKITGDGAVNSLDVALLMWYQFEQPPYDRANLARTPAEISTVARRHDTWKRCGTNEARTNWQVTVGNDYCATSVDDTSQSGSGRRLGDPGE